MPSRKGHDQTEDLEKTTGCRLDKRGIGRKTTKKGMSVVQKGTGRNTTKQGISVVPMRGDHGLNEDSGRR